MCAIPDNHRVPRHVQSRSPISSVPIHTRLERDRVLDPRHLDTTYATARRALRVFLSNLRDRSPRQARTARRQLAHHTPDESKQYRHDKCPFHGREYTPFCNDTERLFVTHQPGSRPHLEQP